MLGEGMQTYAGDSGPDQRGMLPTAEPNEEWSPCPLTVRLEVRAWPPAGAPPQP